VTIDAPAGSIEDCLAYWKNGLRPFFGQRLRCRRQKAWFLPAAPQDQRTSDGLRDMADASPTAC
jgi:hypothetical protein